MVFKGKNDFKPKNVEDLKKRYSKKELYVKLKENIDSINLSFNYDASGDYLVFKNDINVNDLILELHNKNLTILEIFEKTPTLEEAYLKITGGSIENNVNEVK